MNVITQIEKLCRQKGITIRQLEHYVGIGNGVIGKWRKASPTASSLIKVAEHFDVSLDYITGQTEIRNAINYFDQLGNVQWDEVRELEVIIKNLLSKVDSQDLTFDNELIDSEMAEIIKNTLKLNLELWALVNRKKI
jgi:transcriptional regulator with XRE-family HTH domain